MKWLVILLLAVEVALAGCALCRAIDGNMAILLLAVNSALLLWSAARWRAKPSCCR